MSLTRRSAKLDPNKGGEEGWPSIDHPDWGRRRRLLKKETSFHTSGEKQSPGHPASCATYWTACLPESRSGETRRILDSWKEKRRTWRNVSRWKENPGWRCYRSGWPSGRLTGSETWFLFGRKIRLNRKQRRLFQELFPMIFFKTALMIWLVFLASESLLVSDEEQDQRRRVSNKRITKNSLRSSLFSFYTSTRVRTSFRREPQ